MGRIHRYEGREIVVDFELGRCIHTGDCTRALPTVFDTKRRGRWVHPDGASKEEVVRVCAACPTGALRARDPETGELLHPKPERNTVRVVPDGPLYVRGEMRVNGVPEPAFTAAFCRCGRSRLMPYCDESHRQDFRDAGLVSVPLPSPAGDNAPLEISFRRGGSLKIQGPFTLIDGEGREICESGGSAFCRCGASKMKPYCDGTHRDIGFEDGTE